MNRGRLAAAGGLLLVLVGAVATLFEPAAARAAGEAAAWPSWLLGVGGLALLLGAWLEREPLRRALATRQARHGLIAGAYTALVLLGLAAFALLLDRQGLRHDLTRGGTSSLDADTLRVIREIPDEGGPLEIHGFIAGGGLQPIDTEAARAELAPLFRLLAQASPRVRTGFADATREPVLTRSLGIGRLPSVAVRWTPADGGAPRVVRTDVLTEREISRAIEEALVGELTPVHVLQGHGEMSAADVQGSGGLFGALMAVASDNYDVRPWNLVEEGGLPEDAELLVIAGPQSDYVPAEVGWLSDFLQSGGRALILVGPAFGPDGRVLRMPVLEGWLRSQLGLELGASVVCDLEGLSGPGADVRTLVLPAAGESTHPIVRGRDRLLVFPFARPLVELPSPPHGAHLRRLASTGRRSWAEAETPAAPAFDPADERGPQVVAMAATYKPWDQEKAARLVILGSHLFASNAMLPLAGNRSFLLDALAWLDEREAVLEARQGRGRDGTAVIPYRQGVLILLCAGALPVVVAAFGVVTWWYRRRL